MSWSRKLRHLWHETFYWKAGPRRIDFGLTCERVTSDIDLRIKDRKLLNRLRLHLHLSFCQACLDYRKWSLILRRGTRGTSTTVSQATLDRLQKSLLEKHGKR